MDERISALQQRQFGNMHQFHTERTARLVSTVLEHFGDGVLEAAGKVNVDRPTLYQWHMARTAALIDGLTAAFGPAVLEVVRQAEAVDAERQGQQWARELGSDSLESLVAGFSGGDPSRVTWLSPTEALVRTEGCLAAQAAVELGRGELFYGLHCATDRDLVRGFNPSLDCEVRHTTMEGHDYCEHRLFVR